MRRDILATFTQGDSFGFAFDTFHDRRNGYQFSINTIGGRIDAQTTDERQFNSDWNPIWSFSTGRFPGGWIAEVAVPFSSLRYPPGRARVCAKP